jgi:hypothetical protein
MLAGKTLNIAMSYSRPSLRNRQKKYACSNADPDLSNRGKPQKTSLEIGAKEIRVPHSARRI